MSEKSLLPHTLRARLMLFIVPLVTLSILATGYFIGANGRDTLLQEKRDYLLGITRLMVDELVERGGYSGLAAKMPRDNSNVAAFNRELAPFTETVARAFPGVGVGHYHRGLDAILSYGPVAENGKSIGKAIGPDHPGRQVMSSAKPAVQSGQQVRGNIMNAMTPIVEKGEVVGYVWANVLIDDIDRQIAHLRNTVLLLSLAALILSLLLVYWIVTRLTRDVSIIKEGLTHMQDDLRQHIPALQGETGDIVEAINKMAAALLLSRQHEQKLAAAALRQTQETLHTAISAIDEAFVLYDQEDRLVTCNEKYLQVHQRATDLMIPGKTFAEISRACAERGIYPDAIGRIDEWVAERLAQHQSGQANVEMKTEDGRWLRIVDRRTATGHILGFRVDITDLKHATEAAQAANRKLEELASKDGLTGLNNRRSMDNLTDAAWERACAAAESFAILMIDVDNFKKYNDFYGHQAGDDCLRQIAASIAETVTASNASKLTTGAFAARYGGEEFAVVIPHARLTAYQALGHGIVTAIREKAITHEKNADYGVATASIGGVFIEHAAGRLAMVFRNADRQLYSAKEQGRNRAELSDDTTLPPPQKALG